VIGVVGGIRATADDETVGRTRASRTLRIVTSAWLGFTDATRVRADAALPAHISAVGTTHDASSAGRRRRRLPAIPQCLFNP
jgi:hypothetical protein